MSGMHGLLCAAMLASAIPEAAQASRCGDGRGHRLVVVGLTDDQRLVRFRACRPGRVKEIAPVSGLGGADSALVGIDFRAQDGLLYGVGNGGGIYQLDTETGVALVASQLGVALEGSSFGVDFNPAANRLRVISNTGQNLRHNLLDGSTATDLPLKNGDVTAQGVAGAGYTNNDLEAATSTTLLDVDTAQDQLSVQSPPNNGSLVATGKLTVDAGSAAGFDIFTRLRDGAAVANWGFASLEVAGVRGFYRINLLTGRATPIGTLGDSVVDIALPLDQ